MILAGLILTQLQVFSGLFFSFSIITAFLYNGMNFEDSFSLGLELWFILELLNFECKSTIETLFSKKILKFHLKF